MDAYNRTDIALTNDLGGSVDLDLRPLYVITCGCLLPLTLASFVGDGWVCRWRWLDAVKRVVCMMVRGMFYLSHLFGVFLVTDNFGRNKEAVFTSYNHHYGNYDVVHSQQIDMGISKSGAKTEILRWVSIATLAVQYCVICPITYLSYIRLIDGNEPEPPPSETNTSVLGCVCNYAAAGASVACVLIGLTARCSTPLSIFVTLAGMICGATYAICALKHVINDVTRTWIAYVIILVFVLWSTTGEVLLGYLHHVEFSDCLPLYHGACAGLLWITAISFCQFSLLLSRRHNNAYCDVTKTKKNCSIYHRYDNGCDVSKTETKFVLCSEQ